MLSRFHTIDFQHKKIPKSCRERFSPLHSFPFRFGLCAVSLRRYHSSYSRFEIAQNSRFSSNRIPRFLNFVCRRFLPLLWDARFNVPPSGDEVCRTNVQANPLKRSRHAKKRKSISHFALKDRKTTCRRRRRFQLYLISIVNLGGEQRRKGVWIEVYGKEDKEENK